MSIVTPVGIEDPGRSLARKTLVGGIVTVVVASVALLLALTLFSRDSSTILRVYFGVIGIVIGLTTINRFVSVLYDTGEVDSIPARKQRQTAPNWPGDLFDLEDRVSLAKVSAFDYQSRLRPLIRELASQRMAAHWQIDMAGQPAAASTHLGEALRSELFDEPDAADARDLRDVPGPSAARVQRLIDELEAI